MLIQFVLSSAPPPPAAPAAPAAQGSPQEREPKRDAKGGLVSRTRGDVGEMSGRCRGGLARHAHLTLALTLIP